MSKERARKLENCNVCEKFLGVGRPAVKFLLRGDGWQLAPFLVQQPDCADSQQGGQ